MLIGAEAPKSVDAISRTGVGERRGSSIPAATTST